MLLFIHKDLVCLFVVKTSLNKYYYLLLSWHSHFVFVECNFPLCFSTNKFSTVYAEISHSLYVRREFVSKQNLHQYLTIPFFYSLLLLLTKEVQKRRRRSKIHFYALVFMRFHHSSYFLLLYVVATLIQHYKEANLWIFLCFFYGLFSVFSCVLKSILKNKQ